MDSLKDCSTFPVFEGTFEPPIEKRKYILDKCQISTDGFPTHLRTGFYKLLIIGIGEIAAKMQFICKIERAT